MIAYNDLPSKYLENMKSQLGADFNKYIDTLSERPYAGIRINTLKTCPDYVFNGIDVPHENIPWTTDGFYVDDTYSFTKHPFYYAGLYYIQEPSAMTPVTWLDVKPNDRVLDLCAAPGGKSTQIAQKLGPEGVLYTNDPSASRCKALLKNIELFGIDNAIITSAMPEELSAVYPLYFDKILVDAPCSGEGMFRKNREVLTAYLEHGPEYFAPIQRSCLTEAVRMLKPGGILVFSTCTFSTLEDEENIEWLVKTFPEMKLVDYIKLYPHEIKGEGHFVSKFIKTGELLPNLVNERQKYIKDEYTYLLPNGAKLDKSLHYIRTGLLLGRTRHDDLEPSQASAMAKRKSELKNAIHFSVEDDRVIRYLKGETIDADDQYNGYRVVCIDDYPLGWVKQSGYRCKNKYYPGWRWN